MSEKIWVAEIVLDDYLSPNATDTAVGLYAISTTASGSNPAGQKVLNVASSAEFRVYDKVYISEGGLGESNFILAIAGNTLHLVNNLVRTYTGSAVVNACSNFRWAQNDSDLISIRHAGTMLVANGIEPFSRGIDLKRGGNVAYDGECNIKVKNTSNFSQWLKASNIYMIGNIVRLSLYTDGVERLYWTGVTEKPTWNSTVMSIPVVGMNHMRRTNIAKIITTKDYPDASAEDTAKIVPITFGENEKARFNRVSNKEEILKANYWSNGAYPTDTTVFPLISESATAVLVYDILYGTATGFASPERLIGKYMKIVDGSKCVGEYRYITNATPDGRFGSLRITVAEYYSDILIGSDSFPSATPGSWVEETDNAWVSFIDIARDYICDTWPCKDFLDENGNVITKGDHNLFAYQETKEVEVTGAAETVEVKEFSAKFVPLPRFAYKEVSGNIKNMLDIDIKMFQDNIDSLNSFLILPVTNILLSTAPDLTYWGLASSIKLSTGLYSTAPSSPITRVLSVTGAVADVIDKDEVSALSLKVVSTSIDLESSEWELALEFKLPALPENFTFDNCYLGIRLKVENIDSGYNFSTSTFNLLLRRFVGTARQGITTNTIHPGSTNDGSTINIESLPDIYFGIESSEESFYVTNTVGGKPRTGYINFAISNISNIDEYNAIEKCLIHCVYAKPLNTAAQIELHFEELGIVFSKKASIRDAIYSPHKGRIYNATWGGRVTATDLIANPLHQLEHIVRLQNWSECSLAPSGGYGFTYSDLVKVRTGYTDYSFDGLSVGDDIRTILDLESARQIFELAEAYTDEMKISLCRNLSLASWVGHDGFEQVSTIKKPDTAVGQSITLNQILDRKSITIKESDPADIFAEPFVRYMINPATGQPESTIRFKNVSADTYSPDFVEYPTGAISAADAEEYWNRCHVLWNKAGCINTPPSDLTDLLWANGVQEHADRIAWNNISQWIDWMYNAVITFKVHQSIAGEWEECHRFGIQLPHQTNNVVIQCLATKITVNPNPPYEVTVEAILFSDTIPEDYNLQDVWDTLTSDRMWQESYTSGTAYQDSM